MQSDVFLQSNAKPPSRIKDLQHHVHISNPETQTFDLACFQSSCLHVEKLRASSKAPTLFFIKECSDIKGSLLMNYNELRDQYLISIWS